MIVPKQYRNFLPGMDPFENLEREVNSSNIEKIDSEVIANVAGDIVKYRDQISNIVPQMRKEDEAAKNNAYGAMLLLVEEHYELSKKGNSKHHTKMIKSWLDIADKLGGLPENNNKHGQRINAIANSVNYKPNSRKSDIESIKEYTAELIKKEGGYLNKQLQSYIK